QWVMLPIETLQACAQNATPSCPLGTSETLFCCGGAPFACWSPPLLPNSVLAQARKLSRLLGLARE
ncbi:hypothetical protein P7K49_038173, partial [Saguinus oedipus]